MTSPTTDPNQMTFLEHLAELRKRILYSLASIVIAFIGCYAYSEKIFYYTVLPWKRIMPAGSSLIGTGIAEAFTSRLLVSALAALIISSPFWFYELWMFISPGLYKTERRLAPLFVFFTTVSFSGGIAFGYLMVFPAAFPFFLEQFTSTGLVPQIRISQYLSFVTRLLIAFGLCFEMPIISFFLGRLGFIDSKKMMKAAKYAVIVIFITAAVLTPGPDVASQLMLAGPLLVLYGLSIGIVAATGKKKAAATTGD